MVRTNQVKLIERGTRFGKLVVDRQGASDGGARWWCDCDCGNRTIVKGVHLRQGLVKSCGCITAEANRKYQERCKARKSFATVKLWVKRRRQ